MTGSSLTIDFVPAAVGAAKDGEHVVFPRTGEKKIDDIGNWTRLMIGIWKDIRGRRIDLRAFLIGTLPVAAVVEQAHGIPVGAGFWAPVSRATR
jgi:hypothetical protein